MSSNHDYTESGNSNYIYGHDGSPYGDPYGSPYGAPYGNGAYGSPYGAPYGNGAYAYGNGAYAYGNGAYGNGNYVAGNSHYYGGGNGQYYGGGNGQYYGGGNGQYYGGGNGQNQDGEEKSNFAVMEWVLAFLHYWYLFVIALAIAMGLSMLKNRKWVPTYYSQGTLIIKESGYYAGNSTLFTGFGVDAGLKNVNNQMIMLGSYDLLCRVVDSLPFMRTEYITQGRFKTRNLYRQTPVLVEPSRVDPRANGVLFQVSFERDGSMRIQSTSEDVPLNVVAHYGEPITCSLFDAVVWPTEMMVNSGKVYFRFRTRESLVDEFMGRMSLSFVKTGSSVLSIALSSEVPQRDCEFIDKLAEIYLQQNLEMKNAVADNSIQFINEQLGQLRGSLTVTEGAMTNFRQQNKLVNVGSYASELMGRISGYDQEALNMRLRETYFDYLTNYLETNIESGAVIAPSSLGINEPMLMSLVQQLNDLRLKRGELSEKNVYYSKYTKDIEHVKEAMAEVVSTMRASMEIAKKDLDTRYKEAEQDLQKLPSKELQMIAIERNYRIDDNYYTFFLQKRAEAEIQKASNTPDNQVLDRARTTAITNSKDRRKTTSTYLLIGLLIPLALIVLSELLNNKIRSPRDVQRLGLFRLIGSIRHARSQNPTLVRANPRSSYAEMLRSIRTRVEFITRRKDDIVLLVTSTESGDGKTFLSTNMAALYAMTGKRTLLIDLDMRKPNIHVKLGLENGSGISNYLIGDCELEEAMVRNTPFGFDVMRAGTVPPNPGELAHSDKLRDLLIDLRKEYTYIVIDTSPIGLVPDAYALLEQVDLGLYVIRCMQTNKAFCKTTLQQISEVVDSPEKVQIVLSDIPTEGRHAYGYGYGYGYGGYGYGGYGYGYGGGYGYGYGRGKKSGWRYRYGRLYGKLTNTPERNAYNYYSDDEDEEEEEELTREQGYGRHVYIKEETPDEYLDNQDENNSEEK